LSPSERAIGPNHHLLALLPWTTYILWVLSSRGPQRFGQLRRAIEGISAKVLTERLRLLEREGVISRTYRATIPPEVTYALTERGCELAGVLDALDAVARRWYGAQANNQDAA
jgi:DNA-binding HxlR family transcriptional regulator